MSFQIFVRALNGKTITLYVDENETVESLSDRISQHEHIATRFFRLRSGGRPLDPPNPLSHYNITKQSTVHMAASLSAIPTTDHPTAAINIISQQGAEESVYQLTLDSGTSTTLGSLKAAVGQRYHLAVGDCVLCGHSASREEVTAEAWTSQPLCEGKTMLEYGILDGHWLVLRPRTAAESL